ncbi:MAG TPA: hypothetical protein VMB27_14215 [Solirubrobacteraceae bacterium]|nr:hypothetical protein [Solirubrobacteraceae bacterium]
MVAVTDRAGHDRATEQAVALESDQQLAKAMGRLRAEQPATNAQRGEVRLVAGALCELRGAADQTLRIARGVDDGLGIQVDDGTLLLLPLFTSPRNFPRSGSFSAHMRPCEWGLNDLKAQAYREKPEIIRTCRGLTDFAALRRCQAPPPTPRGGGVHIAALDLMNRFLPHG